MPAALAARIRLASARSPECSSQSTLPSTPPSSRIQIAKSRGWILWLALKAQNAVPASGSP